MRPTQLKVLLERIAGEYRAKGSIYEIPARAFMKNFALEAASPGLKVMGGRASLPVGPAAGPHTQIAPNLVAAYLAGARAFELKTVQENDSLDIAKPCIDALDEGHNTEWSTELSLDQAREEYLSGWIAVNLLASIFSERPRDFFFNMSVGYSLAGIKGKKVDAYIEGMRRPADGEFWKGAMRDLDSFVNGPTFLEAFGLEALRRAHALMADFPSSPVHSVTLSTMHGCPPDEIERIGRYLIEEKGFDTYIKLNPTLLGFDAARSILDATGWKDIEIRRENFEHDLQWEDALALIRNLSAAAESRGLRFGIKLSNTLANRNDGSFLPGEERYMSGRALYPITVSLAAKLAAALPGFPSRFSYCGGASALNAGGLVAAGLGPLTVATEVLKPGGYLRFGPMAEAAVAALSGSPDRPDAAALARLAKEALERPEFRGDWKSGNASIEKPLPLFDCFSAPCVEACPVHQKAPAYIREGGKEPCAGLCTILADNPLPHITGVLCDHVCESVCSRQDYEGPVSIRASKLACVRLAERADRDCEASGDAQAAESPRPAEGAARLKVAVIGAGPAGLSCAASLAQAGAGAVVFDRAAAMGGVPVNTIPLFRIGRGDVEADMERIRSLGVEFRLGAEVRDLEELRAQGFTDFFAAPGAPVARDLPIKGEGLRKVDALAFLEETRGAISGGEPSPYGSAARIVVAGGGNTALDAARAALRLPGVESVTIAYRRTRGEMPADREELEAALAEGALLMELALPEEARRAGEKTSLVLRRMRLGAPDSSGRPRPEPSERTELLDCDLLVSAIGEAPDAGLFRRLNIVVGENGRPAVDPETQETRLPHVYSGGDAARGPASIIAACADGRRAALAMLKASGLAGESEARYAPPEPDPDRLAERGRLLASLDKLEGGEEAFLKREGERCLSCDSACLRCVEVCPNRANIAIPRSSYEGSAGLSQAFEILHVDYLCNECGNCGRFCPYEGEPFSGKPSLFESRERLAESRNAGFAFALSGGDAARPRLFLRAEIGGELREFGYEEWGGAGERAETQTMLALASAVYSRHSYLLKGGEAR